ncbi:MAG: chromate transporter [Christensenellaceae bacterium]|jgi:chromate transporter|nr:chromate transporter [Christensenellaceae bacterium]
MKKSHILADLVLTFMKIGLFTFGGGYAMIALMDNECVEKKKWLTHDEFMDMTAIAESTPGPIAINGATYIGYQQVGIPGAVLSTLGMVFPSFVILYVISLFFDNLLEIAVVAHAFQGIKIAVGILIFNAAIKMLKKMHKKAFPITIMVCAFAASLVIHFAGWHISSLYLILLSGVAGYIFFMVQQMKNRKGAAEQ